MKRSQLHEEPNDKSHAKFTEKQYKQLSDPSTEKTDKSHAKSHAKLHNRILSFVLAGALVLGVTACAATTTTPATTAAQTTVQDTTAAETGAPTNDSKNTDNSGAPSTGDITFTPGTYEGEADGFKGKVKVSLTLTENAIADVKVDHHETEGLGDKAIDNIVDKVKAETSLNIDIVSGATYSSNGVIGALTAAFAAAGADVEALKNKQGEGASETPAGDIEKTTDVLIIGGGGAGLAAAVSAHENGAKVIVLEKMPRLGGNTIISGSAYNAADPERQAKLEMTALEKETVEAILADTYDDETVKTWQTELQAEWDDYLASGKTTLFDSPNLHKMQTWLGGDKKGNPALIDELGENALPALEWLEAKGMGFQDTIFTVLGGLWNRAHKPEKPLGTGFMQTYEDYIDANSADIEVILEARAEKLTIENNVVTGAVATGKNGKITVHAKSVIVATGGFGANIEMRNQYNTELWPDLTNLKTTNHTGATGDGITMGLDVGAALTGMEDIQLLPMGDPETGSLSGNIEQGVQNRLFVNKEGARFVDEGARRDVMTKALMEQTDSWMWVIVDKNSYPTGDTKNNFNESIDELVAAGRAYKADTLEDLAKAIGVDPATFVKSIETFNEAVDGTVEDEFGRTLFDKKIDQAPFYAGARVPTVHHTMGGLVIDPDTHVLNESGTIIQGLYAAGEVTGGIHGTNRLGGNALADINVFGRIAGSKAAKGE